MSTFMDLAAIDLHPGHDPGPALTALRDGATDCQLWVVSLPDERSRLLLSLDVGEAEFLIKRVFAVAGEHIARILVMSDRDEFGIEEVVLANRQGRLVRTRHSGSGTDGILSYEDFPMDEGLSCESDDPDDVLNGPQARARTAELYGVEAAALESWDWWRPLGVEEPSGKPDLVLGKPWRIGGWPG
jgi:hypothetical protein